MTHANLPVPHSSLMHAIRTVSTGVLQERSHVDDRPSCCRLMLGPQTSRPCFALNSMRLRGLAQDPKALICLRPLAVLSLALQPRALVHPQVASDLGRAAA